MRSQDQDRRPASEDEILALLESFFQNTHPCLDIGRGDDCALLKAGADLCVSSDLFLEDTHFRRSYFTAEETGYKSLAVNISDLAACGARPFAFTLSLGIPEDITINWLNGFFEGMSTLSSKYGMTLAGGDLSASEKLLISITVMGERLPERTFLSRGNFRPGDTLFIVGDIGLASIGLRELERCGRMALAAWPEACRAHLRPMPQVRAGLRLAEIGGKTGRIALMDISDGLIRDLPRLLGRTGIAWKEERSPGAELFIQSASLHKEVLEYSGMKKLDPVLMAISGGEDYSLLGACAPELEDILRATLPDIQIIGSVTNEPVLTCNGMDIGNMRGFDHFSDI